MVKDTVQRGEFDKARSFIQELGDDDKFEGKLFETWLIRFEENHRRHLDLSEELLDQAKSENHPVYIFKALVNLSIHKFWRGNFNDSLELIRQAEKQFQFLTDEESEFLNGWDYWINLHKGYVMWHTGEKENGKKQLVRSIEELKDRENKFHFSIALVNLYGISLAEKEYEKTENCIIQALQIVKSLDYKFWESVVLTQFGILKINQEQYETARKFIIEALDLAESINSTLALSFSTNWIRILNERTNQIDDVVNYFQARLDNPLLEKRNQIIYHTRLAQSYKFKGLMKKALSHREIILDLRKKVSHDLSIAWEYESLGNTHRDLGNWERAFKCYNKSLELNRKHNNLHSKGTITGHMAMAYQNLGKHKKAIEFAKESKKHFDEEGHSINSGVMHAILSKSLRVLGEFEEALFHDKEQIRIIEKMDSALSWPVNLGNYIGALSGLGMTYLAMGDYTKARDFFSRSYKLEKKKFKRSSMFQLYHLVSVNLHLNEIQGAEKYFAKMVEIDQDEERKVSPFGKQLLILAEASILKMSKRMSDKGLALNKFKEIAEDIVLNHEFTLFAMFNLCDLLIDELKLEGSPEILDELVDWSDKIYEIARSQNSYPVLIKSLIIQSKLALIDSDIDKSQQLLDKAKKITEEMDFDNLRYELELIQDNFNQEISKWKHIIETNTPLIEKIELSDIQKYLTYAIEFTQTKEKEIAL